MKNNPALDDKADDPCGCTDQRMIFGGRRSKTIPPPLRLTA